MIESNTTKHIQELEVIILDCDALKDGELVASVGIHRVIRRDELPQLLVAHRIDVFQLQLLPDFAKTAYHYHTKWWQFDPIKYFLEIRLLLIILCLGSLLYLLLFLQYHAAPR